MKVNLKHTRFGSHFRNKSTLNKLFLALILCCETACAQQSVSILGHRFQSNTLPTQQHHFQDDTLPTPPQQHAPWPHSDDALSTAIATLFEQGLADPRGLEYREIEIAVGNPWNGGGLPFKTHGWILPPDSEAIGKATNNNQDHKGERFAVAWNGLVYPVVHVGATVDLNNDWPPGATIPQASNWQDPIASEAVSVNFAVPSALKAVLLLRLGQTEIASRVLKSERLEDISDPYLSLANDWAWFAFERASCAHQRGDDRLALADARLLTKIQPLITAEVQRRGFRSSTNNSNLRTPNNELSYLPFLKQLPALLADSERRVTSEGTLQKGPLHSTNQQNPSLPTKDIAALIDDLENVDARQWGQPGGVSLAGDPRVAALVAQGDAIVEPLLETLEKDERLTRSVSFQRNFMRSRHLISVPEAAYAALVDLLRVEFKTYGENGKPLSRKELAVEIRAYWKKMAALPPVERFYELLKDDKADKDYWLQAAANIVQPTDVESHGNWTTIPDRKPGQKIRLRGESLRDGRTPSVAQLLAKRADEIASMHTPRVPDRFLYLNAGQMALHLADWDKTTAIPVLKKLLQRAWSIGVQPDDSLGSGDDVVDYYGTMIAKMTLAHAVGGDEAAYDEYATWIQRIELKNVSFRSIEMQKPLIEGAAHPSIKGAQEYLFNDPKSPWSNILDGRNLSWLLDFWQTPLPRTAGFSLQALRALNDKTFAGEIKFHPRKDRDKEIPAAIQLKQLGFGFRGSPGDPDIPPAGQKRAFRVCDIYAYFYSHYQNGPKFQLYWPEKKRDAGVLACQKWLIAIPER